MPSALHDMHAFIPGDITRKVFGKSKLYLVNQVQLCSFEYTKLCMLIFILQDEFQLDPAEIQKLDSNLAELTKLAAQKTQIVDALKAGLEI